MLSKPSYGALGDRTLHFRLNRFFPSVLVHQLDVLKGRREPDERLNLVRIPLDPGADGRRRVG